MLTGVSWGGCRGAGGQVLSITSLYKFPECQTASSMHYHPGQLRAGGVSRSVKHLVCHFNFSFLLLLLFFVGRGNQSDVDS